jgi:hypothetical protein
MTENQKKLLHSFPASDRGMINNDPEDEAKKAPELVAIEDDFVEAAKLKAKLKQ